MKAQISIEAMLAAAALLAAIAVFAQALNERNWNAAAWTALEANGQADNCLALEGLSNQPRAATAYDFNASAANWTEKCLAAARPGEVFGVENAREKR